MSEKTIETVTVRPKVVFARGPDALGAPVGALYVDDKLVIGYYTESDADLVKALGFTPEEQILDTDWYYDQAVLPEKLEDCKFNPENKQNEK